MVDNARIATTKYFVNTSTAVVFSDYTSGIFWSTGIATIQPAAQHSTAQQSRCGDETLGIILRSSFWVNKVSVQCTTNSKRVEVLV